MDTQFDEFLIKSFSLDPEKIESFLNRQAAVRDLFKGKGEEISWILDLTYVLFLLKNFKIEDTKFKLKKNMLEKAQEYCLKFEELKTETELLNTFLK